MFEPRGQTAGARGAPTGRRQRPLAVVTPILLATLACCALLTGGCGDSDRRGSETAGITESRPAPPASDFPPAAGRELGEVIDRADPPLPTDPVVTPLTQVFYEGENRYALTLADRERQEITDAEVALYVAPVPGEGEGGAYQQPARGPYPMRLVSLETEPGFRAESTAANPLSATAFYVAEIPFPTEGEWRVEALIREGDRLVAKSLAGARVGEYRGIPRPGQRPPVIETPTAAERDPAELSTRIPADSQNGVSFVDALGEKPIVLLFASPKFCQSGVCGPVVDVAEQVKSRSGDKAEFIHMEIYNDNDPGRGVRPQVREFNLPSEPWLFVIDREGVVRSAIEGPFGVSELTRAVEEASRR